MSKASDIEQQLKTFERISKTSKITGLVASVVFFAIMGFSSYQISEQYDQIDSLRTIKTDLNNAIDFAKKDIAALELKKTQLQAELMNKVGASFDTTGNITSETSALQTSLLADATLKKLVDTTKVNGIVVRYYDRTIEEKRVVLELQSLGYGFERGTALPKNQSRKTNAIWYGAGVPLNDVKIVALAMIRAGTPIQGIQPFQESASNPGYKRNIIEVGTSIYLDDRPVENPDYIATAKKFTRLD